MLLFYFSSTSFFQGHFQVERFNILDILREFDFSLNYAYSKNFFCLWSSISLRAELCHFCHGHELSENHFCPSQFCIVCFTMTVETWLQYSIGPREQLVPFYSFFRELLCFLYWQERRLPARWCWIRLKAKRFGSLAYVPSSSFTFGLKPKTFSQTPRAKCL